MTEPQMVVQGLLRVLADTVVLLTKTRHTAWQLQGIDSEECHVLLRQKRRRLTRRSDRLVSIVHRLGGQLPPSPAALARMSSLNVAEEHYSANAMIASLANDHRLIVADVQVLRELLAPIRPPAVARLLEAMQGQHSEWAAQLDSLWNNPNQPKH